MPHPPPPSVRVRAPAKINLALRVGPPRPDGYHPLATVYQAVSLYDEVSGRVAPPGEFRVRSRGRAPTRCPPTTPTSRSAPPGCSPRRTASQGAGASLHINKHIPVAGGLAGGSADGAAALVACATLWGLDCPAAELLGSPRAGQRRPVRRDRRDGGRRGRGEEVAPALAGGTYHWVLAFGHNGLSTPAVYRRFDDVGPDPPKLVVPPELMSALRSGDPSRVGRALVNDLQAAALDLQPRLRLTIEAGLDLRRGGRDRLRLRTDIAFLAANESAAIDLGVALSSEGVVPGGAPGRR